MLRRHVKLPYKFFCVTDDIPKAKHELLPGVNIIPIWRMAGVPVKHPTKPNCYKRLRLFDPDMRKVFGDRIVCMDLDLIITGDITQILQTPGDFVGYNKRGVRYQGAFWIHEIGTRPEVWQEFDPETSPALARKAGYEGSDQAWLSYKLRPNERVLTRADGLYCYDIDRLNARALPPEAKIVFFRGARKPWHPQVFGKVGWVSQHWRLGP